MPYPVLSKPSAAPGISLLYITLGALMSIWSAVWYFWYPPARIGMVVLTGLFLTGLAFLVIGLGVGRIGREARHAELPPRDGAISPVVGAPATVPTTPSPPATNGPPLATVVETPRPMG
jgi:hypothetical protein